MNKLEELINELCPDGVEYKRIDELCIITRGRVMSKDYIRDNVGQYPVYSSQTENNGELGKISTYDFEGEYLTWTTDGANAGSVFYRNGKFSVTNVCGLLKVKVDEITTKYLYHILSITAPKYVNKGMGNPKLMSNVMARIKVPLPPLSIQSEIVHILDSFTLLTAELTAELTARKKQYEYYRDLLLGFGVHRKGTSEFEWRTLESFADVRDGTHDSPKPSDYGYPLVTSKNISGGILDLTSCYLINENDYNSINQRSRVDITDVLVSMIGTIGETIIVTSEPNYAIKNIGLVKTGNLLTSKYIKYYISSSYGQRYIQENIKGTAPRYLSLTALRKFSIPVPPIEEQERIVSILDRFDKLCNDISEGLPAEIEARRKQYEYYRDKLLSFEERKNA